MGSIASEFKFLSYKIDSLHLEMKKSVGILEFQGSINPEHWNFTVNFSEPLFFVNQKKYIGGLNLELRLLDQSQEQQDDKKESLLTVKLNINGIFASSDNNRFSKEIEEKLVKLQIPAILFPYARAAISSTLANAGFGTVMLPLINVSELASKIEMNVRTIE